MKSPLWKWKIGVDKSAPIWYNRVNEREVEHMGAIMGFMIFVGILSAVAVVEWIIEQIQNRK